MSNYAPFSCKEITTILEGLGYQSISSNKSHIVFIKTGYKDISVPRHKEISLGVLMDVVRRVGINKKQFVELREQF